MPSEGASKMRLDQTVPVPLGAGVDQAIDEFLLHQRGARHSQHTINHYTVSLRHLKKHLVSEGIDSIEQVLPKHLRQLFVQLQERFKPKTANGIASDIRAFFSFHERE